MFYQDGIYFAPDADVLQTYNIDTEEYYMPVHSMAAHVKQPESDWYSMSYYPATEQQQYETSYESSVDQNDLVAMPNSFPNEFDNTAYHNAELQFPSAPANSFDDPILKIISSCAVQQPSTQPHKQSIGMAITGKKRKASVESLRMEAPVAKRTAMAVHDAVYDQVDFRSEPSPQSSFVQTPAAVPQLYHNHKLAPSPRINGHQHNISNVSHVSVAAPYTPTVSPSFTDANTEHSPHVPSTPVVRSVSAAPNPKLVRTSTMPQQSPQVLQSTTLGMSQSQGFNPYTTFDGKVVLHVDGDLEAVGSTWTAPELEEGRKILVFSREQQGNDVRLSFKAVTQDKWNNAPYSISCIWWPHRSEAYVTSVDTIQLLELIVGNRFTVEEKNRIRRNLEGFKPETICKGKPDKPESEEFFKVIMAFPNPKPRNIEKDVKAFPWKVLSGALHKIVSKYSASYNPGHPQAKVLRTLEQLPNNYHFDTALGYEHRGAPQLASFDPYQQRATMSAPGTPQMSMHLSHAMQPAQMMPQQYSLVPAPLTVPHYAPAQPYVSQNIAAYDFNQQYTQAPMSGPMTAPIAQGQYWPVQSYAEASQYMSPVSAPASAYPREMIETADFSSMAYNVQPPPRNPYH